MPIPRHPFLAGLVALYTFLILPLALICGILRIIFTFLLFFIFFPWTLVHSSSNWGLSRKENQLTLGYVEEIELKSREGQGDLDVLLRSMQKARVPVTVKFYPHLSETQIGGSPGRARKEGKAHPKLSELFIRLELAGWKRAAVYDLFIALASETGTGMEPGTRTGEDMVAELERVKKLACRGAIISVVEKVFAPLERIFGLLSFEAPPSMLKAESLISEGNGVAVPVVDVDVGGDAKWIMERGAVIRPKNRKTLEALEQLDRDLGVWKFVCREEEVRELGWWQYVVL